ncbi:MAG TPA: hypothetical protein VMG12_14320 [Polyangiaceae bacterium]|nr:hypothetical protein [Polyangiaceae bacterium]
MTTLEELAAALPHGFHDSYLDVWIGDEDGEREAREACRNGRLVIHGLLFCELQTPDAGSPYAEARPLWVDLCEADPSHPLVARLPPGAFAERFFVSNWNAFIQLAGTHAELIWSS